MERAAVGEEWTWHKKPAAHVAHMLDPAKVQGTYGVGTFSQRYRKYALKAEATLDSQISTWTEGRSKTFELFKSLKTSHSDSLTLEVQV